MSRFSLKSIFIQKILLLSFLLLIVFVGVNWFQNRQKQLTLLKVSNYDAGKYNLLWPIPEIAGLPGAYSLRIALDTEAFIGYVPYNDLTIRAWSYGFYKDAKGDIQKVAIPRVWENSSTKKVYFLGTISPPKLIEGYSDKFLITIIDGLNKGISDDRKPLVNIFMAPADPDQGTEFLSFYKSLTNTKLPKSFIDTGSTKDLPADKNIGSFLPVTQLMADIAK